MDELDITARDVVETMAAGAVSQFLGRVPALAMAEVLDSLASSPDLLARFAIEAGAFVLDRVHCRDCGGRVISLPAGCAVCGGQNLFSLYAVAGDG